MSLWVAKPPLDFISIHWTRCKPNELTTPPFEREREREERTTNMRERRNRREGKNPWAKPRDRLLPGRWKKGQREKGGRRGPFDKSLRPWQPAFAESFPSLPADTNLVSSRPTVKCIFRWILACPFHFFSFSLLLYGLKLVR